MKKEGKLHLIILSNKTESNTFLQGLWFLFTCMITSWSGVDWTCRLLIKKTFYTNLEAWSKSFFLFIFYHSFLFVLSHIYKEKISHESRKTISHEPLQVSRQPQRAPRRKRKNVLHGSGELLHPQPLEDTWHAVLGKLSECHTDEWSLLIKKQNGRILSSGWYVKLVLKSSTL